jgi:hypothetical protein
VILSVVCLRTAEAGPFVYENLTTPLGNYVGGFAYDEIADDVVLGPGSRIFESLTIAYAGFNFDGDETVQVTLYAMDGAPTSGSFGFNTPGTVLFTETQPIGATDGMLLTFSDSTGILLPDVVGIGLAFFGVEFDPTGAAADAGPLLYDPPTVGSSLDDFWLRGFPNPGDPWGLFTFTGNPPINLGAQITTLDAVPEPATFGLLAAGLAVMAARRRRSQR